MSEELTRKDSEALVKIVNQRARLAGQQVDALKAGRIAEFEADALRQWDTQMLGISAEVDEVNRQVAVLRDQMEARLNEMGIPDHARPKLGPVSVYAQDSRPIADLGQTYADRSRPKSTRPPRPRRCRSSRTSSGSLSSW